MSYYITGGNISTVWNAKDIKPFFFCRKPAKRLKKENIRFSFELWVGDDEMVSNDQNEDENAEKIGKESEVLVVKHLFTSQQSENDRISLAVKERKRESHQISA